MGFLGGFFGVGFLGGFFIANPGMYQVYLPGGIMREIMLVPLPRAASRDLISFFTFHISTFLSAASTVVSAILKQLEDLLQTVLRIRIRGLFDPWIRDG